MNVYTRVRDLVYVYFDNPRGRLEVYNAFDIKDELKAHGYKFDMGRNGKAWIKQITAETLAAELQFLDDKAAVEAYSTLDYILIANRIPGLPARERKLRKGEWENSHDVYDLGKLLGDTDIPEETRRAIHERRGQINRNYGKQPFEVAVENCREELLYAGGLIEDED